MGREQNAPTLRQNVRPAMGPFARPQLCQWFDGASFTQAVESTVCRQCGDDTAIFGPACAPKVGASDQWSGTPPAVEIF